MSNANKFVSYIFLFIGVVFFSIGLIFGIILPQSFKSHSTEITGTITNIEIDRETYNSGGERKVRTTHYVYVEYFVDDIQYNTCINSYSSSMRVGKDIKLNVDNNDPYNVRCIEVESLLGYIFLVIGIVFLLVGIYFTIKSFKDSKRIKYLLREGIGVLTNVVSVEIDNSVTINGHHPFYYICEDSNGRKFTSDSYIPNKTGGFPLETGVEVPVYIDSNNDSNYFVDILSHM